MAQDVVLPRELVQLGPPGQCGRPTLQDLKTQLEKGTDDSKVETMKRVLTIMLNGDPMPQLLMHIIRFVMPSKSKKPQEAALLLLRDLPEAGCSGEAQAGDDPGLVSGGPGCLGFSLALLTSNPQQRHSE